MRMINADALIEKLEAWKKEAERRDATINYTFASAIIAQVNAEPTIEERKNGMWKEITEGDCSGYDPTLAGYDDPVVGYVCSRCGYGYEKIVMGDTLFNFCPHCGADMRGSKNG